jgi:hypothetical protein
VEFELGKPLSTKQSEGGKHEDTYQYEMANSPNPGRATIYGYVDLVTLGLAEPILTLIELFQGHDEETKVVYDASNRALEITGYRPAPPSQALLAAEDGQRKFARLSPSARSEQLSAHSYQSTQLSIDPPLRELAHRLSASLKERHVVRTAVLPVQDASGQENNPLGNYLTEKLSVKLHEEGSTKVIERAQLTKVTEELALTHTGSFDENSAMSVGRLLGVDAVVTTRYADL